MSRYRSGVGVRCVLRQEDADLAGAFFELDFFWDAVFLTVDLAGGFFFLIVGFWASRNTTLQKIDDIMAAFRNIDFPAVRRTLPNCSGSVTFLTATVTR